MSTILLPQFAIQYRTMQDTHWRTIRRYEEMSEAILLAAGYSTLPEYGEVRVYDKRYKEVVVRYPDGHIKVKPGKRFFI